MKITPAQKIRNYFDTPRWNNFKMKNKYGEYKPAQRITSRRRFKTSQ